jgi:hypothetical protein
VARQPDGVQAVLGRPRPGVVLFEAVQAAQQLQQCDPPAGADVVMPGRSDWAGTGRRVETSQFLKVHDQVFYDQAKKNRQECDPGPTERANGVAQLLIAVSVLADHDPQLHMCRF